MTFKLSNRLMGSPDIYPQPDRDLNRSINFITCHDGFTLNDLVSYNSKHNEANLESNRDGYNYNFSWNCGAEGPTHVTAVKRLRTRQMKNFFTLLLVSQGTPMILMGDEVARTQKGNNNAYCQNSELTWFDWSLTKTNADLLSFIKGLISFTNAFPLFHLRYVSALSHCPTGAVVTWHGVKPGDPDFGKDSHSIALEMKSREGSEHVHLMINAFWEPLIFELPKLQPGRAWHRIVDTYLHPGEDFVAPDKAPRMLSLRYRLQERSIALLVSLP